MESAIKKIYETGFPEAAWTIIIYLNGESDLLDDVKRNYNELAKSGSEFGKVNFVVLFDGLKVPEKWDDEMNSQNLAPALFYVCRYENFDHKNCLEEFPRQENLAKEGNLKTIVDRIKLKFPARKFGFIYNGHGQSGGTDAGNKKMTVKLACLLPGEDEERLGKRMDSKYGKNGWSLIGLCSHVDNETLFLAVFEKADESGNGDYLTYEKLGKELFNSGFSKKNDQQLGFVCLDCCWGQMIETAECFSDVSSYLIASSDETALLGIGYDDFGEFMIKQFASIRYDELANNLVGIYFKRNYGDYLSSPDFKDMGVSLTCVDIKNFGIVKGCIDELSDYLSGNISRLYIIIYKARKKCTDYTYNADPEYYGVYNIDLLWLLENIQFYNSKYASRGNSFFDEKLQSLTSNLIVAITIHFLESHLASNYKELLVNKNEAQLGGKGIAITFPETLGQFENSIYADNKIFSGNLKWKKFLFTYVKHQDGLTGPNNNDLKNILETHSDNFNLEIKYLKHILGDFDFGTHKELLSDIKALPDSSDKKYGSYKWKMIPFKREAGQ